jgi:phosphoribosylformylglycinamidine (FGAM) synthase PurS component
MEPQTYNVIELRVTIVTDYQNPESVCDHVREILDEHLANANLEHVEILATTRRED